MAKGNEYEYVHYKGGVERFGFLEWSLGRQRVWQNQKVKEKNITKQRQNPHFSAGKFHVDSYFIYIYNYK